LAPARQADEQDRASARWPKQDFNRYERAPAEISEAEVTRHLPADLTFLLSRLLKEIEKP
jgi:hypothetical protein